MGRLIYFLCLLLFSIISIFLGFNSTIIPNLVLYLIILFYIINLVLIVNIGLTCVYIKSNSFFDKITNVTYETSNYSVLVLKDSNISDMDEIKELGSWSSEMDTNYDEALSKFIARTDIKTKKFNSVFDIVNAFLEKEIQAIMINDNYIDIIGENTEGFSENIKVLRTESIKSLTEKLDSTVDISNLHSFNVYLSGIDTYGEISTVSRSDVNIIATINLDTGKILLTNTPRDYYVQLAGTTGTKDKLTHAGYYGIGTSVKTLENLYDINIDYYVRVNFSSLISLVDEIGGIDIESDKTFVPYTDRSFTVKYGWNHFNGKQALAYSRERYAYSDGDRHRGRNQQQVIEAILKKITANNDIGTYSKLLNTLEKSFQTSADRKLINSLLNLQIKKNYAWKVESIAVDGYGSSGETYSYPGQDLWIMIPNYDTVNAAKDKIKEFANGSEDKEKVQ